MSRNRRSRRPAVVAGALITICLGMVTAADAGPRGPSAPPVAAQSRPVLDTDYSARPAPPDAETRLSAGDAVVAARGFLMPPDMTPGEPEVGLWLVTYWPVGMTLIESGLATDGVGVASVFTDRLAWVVVFHDSPLDLHGPAPGPYTGQINSASGCGPKRSATWSSSWMRTAGRGSTSHSSAGMEADGSRAQMILLAAKSRKSWSRVLGLPVGIFGQEQAFLTGLWSVLECFGDTAEVVVIEQPVELGEVDVCSPAVF